MSSARGHCGALLGQPRPHPSVLPGGRQAALGSHCLFVSCGESAPCRPPHGVCRPGCRSLHWVLWPSAAGGWAPSLSPHRRAAVWWWDWSRAVTLQLLSPRLVLSGGGWWCSHRAVDEKPRLGGGGQQGADSVATVTGLLGPESAHSPLCQCFLKSYLLN